MEGSFANNNSWTIEGHHWFSSLYTVCATISEVLEATDFSKNSKFIG